MSKSPAPYADWLLNSTVVNDNRHYCKVFRRSGLLVITRLLNSNLYLSLRHQLRAQRLRVGTTCDLLSLPVFSIKRKNIVSSVCSRCSEEISAMKADDKIQRSVLPIPDVQSLGFKTYDAKDPETKFPPIRDLRPPQGAPNVLLILIDDAGFGSSSAFGGPCYTPNAEKLAAGGVKFNRFHTTALCSPTRQALLTGRNHHSAHMGGITEIATSAPGYDSVLPNTMSPLARTLKLNGYSTAQ